MRSITGALDELLVWRPRRRMPVARALLYVVVMAGALAFVYLRQPWQWPSPMSTDGHAIVSFSLAANRAYCGMQSAVSTDANLGAVYMNRADLVDPPIRTVITRRYGSMERYCAYQTGFFVHNENALKLIESWAMQLAPNTSMAGISRTLLAIRALMIALLGVALLRAGAGVLATGVVLLLGFSMFAELPDTTNYSVYAFLFCMVACAAGFYAMATALRAGRSTMAVAVAAGLMTGLFANIRTSYLPILAAMFAIYLLGAVWAVTSRTNRLRIAAASVLLFALAYGAFQYVFVLRNRPNNGEGSVYHVIAHPLVLALAVPANPLAAREGIAWEDPIGLTLARRVDPTAVYLGRGYERALSTYYVNLWKQHPREMLDIYRTKWDLAGRDAAARLTEGPIGLLLAPWRGLSSGFWFLAIFIAGAIAGMWIFLRTRASLLLIVAMFSVSGVLLLAEAAMIMPFFVITYHQTLLFVCGALTVAGAQMLLNGVVFGAATLWAGARNFARRPREAKKTLGERTIADFGEQWTAYTDNDGYYGSPALLQDVFGPLLTLDDFKGKVVADVGAGTGRFTSVFLASETAKVIAVEPSRAFDVLKRNTAAYDGRVEYCQCAGEDFRPPAPIDFAFSYGVLHHIPDPRPTVAAMRDALKSGGRIAIWVYGREGNETYVAAQKVLGFVASRLPHRLLAGFVWLLYWPSVIYSGVCTVLPLPLRRYFTEVYAKLTPEKRRLTLYDQLNPAYAKYYWQPEVRALLQDAGFVDIRTFHRHDYSWTAVAVKP